MALLKCKITPMSAGYSVTPGEQVLRQDLDGGAGYYRQDIAGASGRATVRWMTDRGGYEYMEALFRLTGAKGLPFLIDLVWGTPGLAERTAHFASVLRLESKSGNVHSLSAELEVEPPEIDDAASQSIVDGYVGAPAPQLGTGGDIDGGMA